MNKKLTEFLSVFKPKQIRACIMSDNKLQIAIKEVIHSYNLSDYNFDVNKPVKPQENHLFDKNLVSDIKSLIKKEIGLSSRWFLIIDLQIAIYNLPDKLSITHFLDFGEHLQCRKIKVYRIADQKITSLDKINFDIIQLAAERCNYSPSNIPTKYYE
ncbi:MAG TPA: hypothetical protein VK835_11360 [Bacteroidia bacterium]|jgi:hypothetical protein|nr:hypothetical protein [Bacteroidia bacterium]